MTKLVKPDKKILKEPYTNKVPSNLEIEFKNDEYNVICKGEIIKTFKSFQQANDFINNYKKQN